MNRNSITFFEIVKYISRFCLHAFLVENVTNLNYGSRLSVMCNYRLLNI